MRYSLNHWVRAAIFLVLTVTTAVTGYTWSPPPGIMMEGAKLGSQPEHPTTQEPTPDKSPETQATVMSLSR